MANLEQNSAEDSTVSTSEMKTLGESFAGGLISFDGTKRCSTPGCDRVARRVLLLGREVPSICDPCQAESDARVEREERADRTARLMSLSGRTPKLLQWSLGTYPLDAEGKRVKQEALEWLDGYRENGPSMTPNLILMGTVGSGKTGLAWAIVRDLIEQDGVAARLVNWRVLLADMQAAFGHKDLSVQAALGLDRVPVLCVDDVGSEQPTDWRRGELANLVERREQNLLPTIYTLNYSLKELGQRLGHDDETLGERILSRMLENAQIVKFTGKDRRAKARAAAVA